MRIVGLIVAFVAGFWAVDAFAFHGQYVDLALREAAYQLRPLSRALAALFIWVI